MKKYKLIKTYPGYFNLGRIVEIHSTEETGYYSENTEYWEEIIEKDYEILSFTQDSGITDLWVEFERGWCRSYNGKPVTAPYTTEEILSNKLYSIASVKRLSDGEVFTLGDKIRTNKWGSEKTLDSITTINKNDSLKNGLWFNYEGGSQYFSNTIKVTKKDYEVSQVLYATEVRTLFDGYYRIYPDGIGFDLDYMLNNGGKIHSVNRMSDGERFTVGDRIDIGEPHQIIYRTISMINISSDGTLVIDHEYGGLTNGKDKGIFHRIKHAPLDYEILSYIKKGSKTCTTTKKRGGVRHDEFWNIHSVKRLSDGEIFNIGDDTNDGIISEIHISKSYDGGIYLNIKDKSFTIKLNYVEKLEKGEYDLRYKPCLSLDDIQRAIHLPPMYWNALLEATKAKLNYEQDRTNI